MTLEASVAAAGERALRASALDRVVLAAFTCTSFLAAALLFLVEPMAAKMLLPLFGGSASVWATAMVFFQAVLLAGYLFAHASTRLLGPARQRVVQIGILTLPLASLPVGQHLSAPASGSAPELSLLAMLALAVGAPFFAVTTASPVLQRWFSVTGHPAARDPYFLYAAGNAGSLIALLSYPFVVEPHLTLRQQAHVWSVAYGGMVVLSTACAAALALGRRRASPAHTEDVESDTVSIPWKTRARWVFMAFVPSSLMLGATTYISTDVAAVPLLWVAPLAVYLLTFIVAFARRPPVTATHAARALPIVAVLVLPAMFGAVDYPLWATIALQLVLVFFVGALAHGRLALERPHPSRLTEFYVLLSLGGVLGGVFNALVAPVVFDSVAEYPLVIVLALLLRPASRVARRGRDTLLTRTADLWIPLPYFLLVLTALSVGGNAAGKAVIVAACAGALVFVRRPVRFGVTVALLFALMLAAQSAAYTQRTFYGVLRIVEDGDQRVLVHGRTLHGIESMRRAKAAEPLSYFARSGPLGDVFRELQRDRPFRRVAVIGLGVGSIAAYGRPGERMTFYELDPAVAAIASDRRWFHFLAESPAETRIVLGDGRRSIARAPAAADDLVVIDAFSSDAIPVHLLTREAVQLYLSKLRPRGVLAFHISNARLDLGPVLAAEARALGLVALERRGHTTKAQFDAGVRDSRWVVLARARQPLVPLLRHGWRPLRGTKDVRPWTDDFSNILSVIEWK